MNAKEYKGYVIRAETLEKCLGELVHLHKMQWDEIEEDRPPFKPNYIPFYEHEKMGKFIQICIRKEGELVGGIGFFLFDSMQTSLLSAQETAFYIMPNHRKGMLASVMCSYANEILKKIGVNEIVLTVKSYANTGKLVERLGFKKTDIVYTKNLNFN